MVAGQSQCPQTSGHGFEPLNMRSKVLKRQTTWKQQVGQRKGSPNVLRFRGKPLAAWRVCGRDSPHLWEPMRWVLPPGGCQLSPEPQGGQGWSGEDSENCGQAWGSPREAKGGRAGPGLPPCKLHSLSRRLQREWRCRCRCRGPTAGSTEASPLRILAVSGLTLTSDEIAIWS